MNAPMGLKDRPYNGRLNVKSNEVANFILPGTPVCFPMNLNNDGYGVALPSTVGVTGAGFACGIAVPTQANGAGPGQAFDVISLGFCNYTRLVRGTRAASTDAWPTFAAIGIGDILTINSAANAVQFASTANGLPAAIQCAGLFGATATGQQTAASATTAASNAYSGFSGQTAYVVGVRTFLRLLQ